MARAANNVGTAWRFLLGKGLSPAQAAGVIGSMQGESGKGLDPNATNPGPAHAYGIAQWLGGRKSALLSKKNPSSLTTQLNHVWDELQGPESAALQAITAAHTPEDAAVAWQKVYERGAPFEQKYDQRAANARNVFNSLKGVGGDASALMDASSGSSPSNEAAGSEQGGGLDAAVALLQAQAQQRPVIQSSGIAAPAFSARAAMPAGAQLPQAGGGPVKSGPDLNSLLALVAGSQGQGATPSPSTPADGGAAIPGGSGDLTASDGSVKIAAGANRAGIGLTPGIQKVLRAVAHQANEPLTVGTGTNHNRLTVDGNVSDHWSGNAADIPATGDQLTRLGQDALIAAGMDPQKARQQKGGLFNIPYGDKRRIQIIFQTHQGGDHTNHLHVGVTAK